MHSKRLSPAFENAGKLARGTVSDAPDICEEAFQPILGKRGQTKKRSFPLATRDATKSGLRLGRNPSVRGPHPPVQRTSVTARNDTAGAGHAQYSLLRPRVHMPRHRVTSQQHWTAAN